MTPNRLCPKRRGQESYELDEKVDNEDVKGKHLIENSKEMELQ